MRQVTGTKKKVSGYGTTSSQRVSTRNDPTARSSRSQTTDTWRKLIEYGSGIVLLFGRNPVGYSSPGALSEITFGTQSLTVLDILFSSPESYPMQGWTLTTPCCGERTLCGSNYPNA